MGRVKRCMLVVCAFIFAFAAAVCTSVSGRAESLPDISRLDSSYLLPDNRQILSLPGVGYAVVSTDSRLRTYIAFVNADGELLDDSDPAQFLFVYSKAAVSGSTVYIAGNDVKGQNIVWLGSISASEKNICVNQVDNAVGDFSRGFYTEPDGKLYFVTTAAGSMPSDSAPFSKYIFSNTFGSHLTGALAPDFPSGSSALPSMDSSSNTLPESSSSSPVQPDPSSVSSAGIPSSSSASSDAAPAPYCFSGPITVASLQAELDAAQQGSVVHVVGSGGAELTDGNVGTGSVIEVFRNGQLLSRVTAVVLGDLTGDGTVTRQSGNLLYEYCVGLRTLSGVYLQAADIDRDGKVDSSDILKIKSMIR